FLQIKKKYMSCNHLEHHIHNTLEIVHSFIQQRWSTGCKDKGTIIFFDMKAQIIKEDIEFNLDTVREVIYPASVSWGDTSFLEAITCIYEVVKRHQSKPIVVIFLTDGRDDDRGASDLLAEIKAFCLKGFHFFPCLVYTKDSYVLNKMASRVGAKVRSGLHANDLETQFVGFAKKLANISYTQD
ncbi:hypothetical protein RFI_36253, partial [Reticulomyxa filosa]